MQMLLGALVVAIVTGGLPGHTQAGRTPALSDERPQPGFTAGPAASAPELAGAKRHRSGSPSGAISPPILIRPAIDRSGVSGLRGSLGWMDEIYPVWARIVTPASFVQGVGR